MSRAALLLVVGEAFNETQKTLILDRISEELHSWDDDIARCNLQKELEDFVAQKKSSGDVAVSGAELTHSSDNLSITILFGPDRKLLHESLQNFLLLDSHYRHLVYSGQTVAGSGSWILPDDVFTFRDFVKVLREMDSVGVSGGGKGFTLNVSSTSEWDWNQSNFSRLSNLGVRVAAAGSLSEKGQHFDSLRAFLDPLVNVVDMKDLLKTSSTVGMINFSGPTLYIFPAGNGSSSLFGVKGFTGLIDGGYSRKSCFWDFSRHLHQIDMVILSHLGVSNFLGMQSFLERKAVTESPDVGSVFFNCPEKFRKLPASSESLKVNFFNAGAALSETLSGIGLPPQPCFVPQPFQPITLYNKVGFGSVDMYVLNPVQNTEEMKNFLHQWSMRAESELFSAHSGVPLSSTLSVSILLVWKPFSPSAKIIRILFPGGTPQAKVFEGLDRLKNVPVFERSECSQAELNAKPTKGAQSRPTTLKPMPVKVNGNLDQKESAKAKAVNGSRDSVVGKAKADARETVQAKTSATQRADARETVQAKTSATQRADARETVQAKTNATQRATKVEPKKTEKTDVSHANGTPTPKADSKAAAKPPSPSKSAKDAKTASSRTTENLTPKRLAQKPSEVEPSPKNKPAKASQPEALKQSKPPRRTEEPKASETVKQTPASKQLNVTKEPAPTSKPVSSVKQSPKAAKQTETTKQAKAPVSETVKHTTPKSTRASKESDKKAGKQADSKKQKQPVLEKKDQEKEVKEELASKQPTEEVKQTESPENIFSEPVCIIATAPQQTSALPAEVGLPGTEPVISDVDTATRAADFDLPSPEDVAQMSQEDEDSFVEELPTEMEPVYDDQKAKDSGIAVTGDRDLITDYEIQDYDRIPKNGDIQEISDFHQNDKVSIENDVEEKADLVCSHEIHEIKDFAGDADITSQEIIEDKIDTELQEDLQFQRDEEAFKDLDESGQDEYAEEATESAKPSFMQEPDVIPVHDIAGVAEHVADEDVEGVDDSKAEPVCEDLFSHDHEDLADRGAVYDQDSLQDRDDGEEQEIDEGRGLDEDSDLVKDHDLEKEDFEKEDVEKEDLESDRDVEEHDELQKDRDLEKEDLGKEDLKKDQDLQKGSWLLQSSHSALEQGSFQVKKATDGLARYCEEFGSDEDEAVEDEDEEHKVNEDVAASLGSTEAPAKKGDEEEEEEDEVDELEAVPEEEETDENEGARRAAQECQQVLDIGREEAVILPEDGVDDGISQVPPRVADRRFLPDVLGDEECVRRWEDLEHFGSAESETVEHPSSPAPDFQVDTNDELINVEDYGRVAEGDEDFGKVEHDFEKGEGDFDKVEQDFEKGEGDFDKVEQGFEKGEGDFDKVEPDFEKGEGDFDKVEQDFEKGEGDFDKVEQYFEKGEGDFGKYEDFGKGDYFDKVGDFSKVQDQVEQDLGKVEEVFDKDEPVVEDEEPDDSEELNKAEEAAKDDEGSDVELSETKEGPTPEDGSGGSLSDNEAEEMDPDAGLPLESVDDDVLPCALKKDTAIENLAAICAEEKEDTPEHVACVSSTKLLVGDARPDLVAACEGFEPHDMEGADETDEDLKASSPDIEEADRAVGGHAFELDVQELQNRSLDEGISQGKPRDLHLFDLVDQDEEPSSSSWKLENMAADLAQEVIKSSLASQNLEGSGCSASGPEAAAPPKDTEKLEGHDESTPEKTEDVKNLLNTMVDAVATDESASSGRFNYGFDDDRREDALGAFAANSFGTASAGVQPAQYREKSGEDSGESDLDEGQDACLRGLDVENDQEDGSRLDEGFEEANGDEAPANVTALLHQSTETKPDVKVEDSEGGSASAFGASGEVTDEQGEPSDCAGDPEPASEQNVDDNDSPLVEFDSDVSATHQVAFGDGCVEAQQRSLDAWQKTNLNPFLDPFAAEAGCGDENEDAKLTEDKEDVEQEELTADGETWISNEAGYSQSMAASGLDSEELDRKLGSDEQSSPSDDSALPVMSRDHDQDMAESRSADEPGDKLKPTPEDETTETSEQFEEEEQLEPDLVKTRTDEDSSGNGRPPSFWGYDNTQSTELDRSHSAADNILFSEETTGDVQRDINENLGVTAGLDEEPDEELEEDFEKVSTQSNNSDEGESRSSAVVSEQHEGAGSLDSDEEADPVKSWGQPMGLPAPAQDSNRNKHKTTTSRPSHDAANVSLPVSGHEKKSPTKNNDRSFVAPQKKTNDVRKSGGVLRSTADSNESRENGSVIRDVKTTTTKKPVTSLAPAAKKPITTAADTTSKAKPLKHVVPFYVDLTYIPGNGDPAYVDADFFRRVRARYYVLSSLDPDPRVLESLVEGKQTWDNKDLSVNVIPTHDSYAVHRWFHENAKLVEESKISLLPAANKCTIKLQDKDDGCYAFRIEF